LKSTYFRMTTRAPIMIGPTEFKRLLREDYLSLLSNFRMGFSGERCHSNPLLLSVPERDEVAASPTP